MTWSFSIPHFGPRPLDHPSILGLPSHTLLPPNFDWSRSFCWWELVDLGAFLSVHTYSHEWFLTAMPGTESLVCDPVKLTCPIINNCSLMGCHAMAFRLVWGKVLMTNWNEMKPINVGLSVTCARTKSIMHQGKITPLGTRQVGWSPCNSAHALEVQPVFFFWHGMVYTQNFPFSI